MAVRQRLASTPGADLGPDPGDGRLIAVIDSTEGAPAAATAAAAFPSCPRRKKAAPSAPGAVRWDKAPCRFCGTGCGKCEKSCVLEEAAIKVLPLKVARGELGHHYRKNLTQRSDVGHVGETRAGDKVEATPGLPQFGQPTQRLPEVPHEGDLNPLRSGAAPYQPAPILGSKPGAAP